MEREQIEVALHGAAHGGEAVGRTGDLVAFVAYALPGERVLADVTERRPRFLRARTAEVLEASPDRTVPPCPVFGICGGCHWQHATYAAQLRLKSAVLAEQLSRGGKVADPPVEEPLPSPKEWHYRNTVQMIPSFGPRGGRPGAQRLLCFQRAHSHEPVVVEHCYISENLINRAIHELPWDLLDDATWASLDGVQIRVVPERAVQIVLVARRALSAGQTRQFVAAARQRLPALAGVLQTPVRGGDPAVIWGEDALTFDFGEHNLRVPAGAFVQVNLGAAEQLIGQAMEWLDPAPEDVALDAYAGVGAFALALARRVRSVVAVESHAAAANAAAANAAAHGLMNVLVQTSSVERALPRVQPPVDLVVLDPPRRGCAPEVLAELVRLRPRRVAYASCDPSTLARDVRILGEAGYRLTRSRVVDLFPQTYHLESLNLLEAA